MTFGSPNRVVEYGKTYNVDIFFPKLNVEGVYEVSGQILLLPIKGNGIFKGNFTNSTGVVRLQFGRKDDTGLVTNKKFSIKIKVGKGNIHLDNLFNGDKVLGESNALG